MFLKFLQLIIIYWTLGILLMLPNCNTMIPPPSKMSFGNWENLQGKYASKLDIKNSKMVGVHGNWVGLWSEKKLLSELYISGRQLGQPKIVRQKVFLADGYLDFEQPDAFYRIKNFNANLYKNEKDVSPLSPLGHYIPITFEWSPDGKNCCVILRKKGPDGKPYLKVVLMDSEGNLSKILFEGKKEAPKTALITENWMIIGYRQLAVYDREGNIMFEDVSMNLIPERMEISDDRNVLMIMNNQEVTIYNTSNWGKMDTWKGPWIDASITPSGRFIFAIDYNRKLHIAEVKKSINVIQVSTPPDLITTVKAGNNELLATFSKGEIVRSLSFKNN